MIQTEVAGKILVEMLELGLIQDDDSQILVYEYLMQAYSAGNDNGRLMHILKRPVIQCNMRGEAIEVFESSAIAGRKLEIPRQSITKVCRGKGNHAGGFKFKYVDGTLTDSRKGIRAQS